MLDFMSKSSAQHLWKHFYLLTQTPRPSKKEEKVLQAIIQLANEFSCSYQQDSAGNLVVYVPASVGRENESTVIIQNHVDMVTDARPGHMINFDTDAIEIYRDDQWLRANKTTLGADNGIGCAAALALMTDASVSRPPLELLFTVDEETGLTGALNLDASLLSGKYLVNLDTEEWGSAYVGCAGGADFEFKCQIERQSLPSGFHCFDLDLKNFFGGHSGLDIHWQRANAVKVVVELLSALPEKNWRLMSISSGRAHNIIPRDAKVSFASDLSLDSLRETLTTCMEHQKSLWSKEDQNFEFSIQAAKVQGDVLSLQDHQRIMTFLDLFPHGAHLYETENELKSWNDALVSLSNNLAITHLLDNQFYTLSSLRFFSENSFMTLERKIQKLARLSAIEATKNSQYPSWQPRFSFPLLEKLENCYRENFSEKLEVKAIHAGLECGILIDKMPQVSAVSFGPTIKGAHSPDERVEIESVDKFWHLLKEFMKGEYR